MNESVNDAETEAFLREGLKCFMPAVQALLTFLKQIGERIGAVLKPYDDQLEGLGLASSRSKFSFYPDIARAFAGQVLEVDLKIPDRSGFYIYIDFGAQRSRALYVGFWIWTPVTKDRRSLFAALRGLPILDYPWEIETGDQTTINIGTYTDIEQHFPNFEPLLEETVKRVLSAFETINFSQRFLPGFQTKQVGLDQADATQSP